MENNTNDFAHWAFMQQLPTEMAGFTLDKKQAEQGSQYILFAYRRQSQRRTVTVLYDKATKDFMALVKIGLTEYYDINYITTDLPALEQVLESRLEKMLQTLGEQAADSYESSFTAKKILEWSYTDELPKNIAGFDLFINPHQPVKTINGSYIIIDYCDFAAASNLVVFYNVYRDEFFSELRVKLTPRMLGLFDERDLDQLAKKMKNNLQPVLQGLRAEVGG